MIAVVNSNSLFPLAGSLTEQPFRVQCKNPLMATVISGDDQIQREHPRLLPGHAGTTFIS